MKIVFFGTPHFAIPVLEKLLKHCDVVAIITAPDHFDTKKNQLIPSPIKSFYQHYYEIHTNLDEYHPLKIFSPKDLKLGLGNLKLKISQADLFVIAAYGKLIPKELMDIPVFGALNIHPSLLPKYRGPSPIPAAIINGDTLTGISIIKMDEQLDHGPILASEPVEVLETDTFETLAKRLFEKSADMLPALIKEYTDGHIQTIPQDESKATFTKRITKEDGYLDLSSMKNGGPQPLAEKWKIENTRKIRAYYPWPTVWTKVRIKNQESRIKFLPGKKIQVEGGRPMDVKDFLNGYPELKEIVTKLYAL